MQVVLRDHLDPPSDAGSKEKKGRKARKNRILFVSVFSVFICFSLIFVNVRRILSSMLKTHLF